MTTGIGPRTWRAALVVFLVVFLGGMGLTGASALWSQQGTAVSRVATGHWKATTPGWTVPLEVAIERDSYDAFTRRFVATITWIPSLNSDRTVPGLSYLVGLTLVGDGTVHNVGQVVVDGDKRSVQIQVSREFLSIADFTLRITPLFQGVSGSATVRTIRATGSYIYFA